MFFCFFLVAFRNETLDMQIAVLMSFVVICCFSKGALIKKEALAHFFFFPRASRSRSQRRAKQDFTHNRIVFPPVFFTGVRDREDSSSLARQRGELSRLILRLNVYETAEIRIYGREDRVCLAPCWTRPEMLQV